MKKQFEHVLNNFQVANKRVLITGGSTGIGLATAKLLAQYDAKMCIVARDKTKLDEAVNEIKQINADAEVLAYSIDVSKQVDLADMFAQIDKKWNGLDILINNAALGFGSVIEGDYNDLDFLVRTNLTSYLVCSKEAFVRMKKQRQGHIILIGSMSAETKDEDSSLYVATKVAIQGFAESFRKEVNEYGIHVTLIEPGAVDTPMQTMSQAKKDKQVKDLEMLRSEDIAQAILYVLSQNERCSVVDLKIRPLKQLI